MELNHGIDIYPGWSNTSNFAPTDETFGTVPLHSKELGDAMARIEVSAEVKASLSSDQRYLCGAMGTPLPLLPIHGKQELALFSKLALEQLGGKENVSINFDALAIEWCSHVDGRIIFPKLPVYLKQHFTSWQRNQRIKDTLRAAQPQIDALLAMFAKDVAPARDAPPTPARDAQPAPAARDATPDAPVSPNADAIDANDTIEPDAQASPAPVPTPAPTPAPTPTPTSRPPVRAHVVFTPVLQHLPLHQAPAEMVAAQAAVATYVAGVQLGVSAARPPRYVTGRKRGKDKPKPPGEPSNRVRTCRICEETYCPGRWGGDKCRELQED